MFKEIEFLRRIVSIALEKNHNKIEKIERKATFDLVTDVDKNIEYYLINNIKKEYPSDRILSEETNYNTQVLGRTWTIDPIDGTLNFVHKVKIYGIQISLIRDGDVELSYIYFPEFRDEYFAVKGQGCYLNGERVFADKSVSFEDAIVSFGDYTHKDSIKAMNQHKAIGLLYPLVAKIRMFGSAAFDLSLVASGSTAGCVIITKNLWDILPGYLLAKEAGAVITNLEGKPYCFGDDGIIVSSNLVISNCIIETLK